MLLIIRHGQTKLNKAQVLQGRSDQPLNEEGIRQAREAGLWLKEQGITVDKVYTSPLVRAVQTAQLVCGEPLASEKLVTDFRLIEMDYGPYEGADLTTPAPELLAFFQDFVHTPAPEGMEQLADIIGRLGELLEEIRVEAEHSNVLLSTHAIAMKGALEYLTPSSGGSYWSKYIGNCAIYQAEIQAGRYTIPREIHTEKEN